MLFYKNIKPYNVKRKNFKGINANLVYLGFPDKYLYSIKDKCITAELNIEQNDELIKITGFNDCTQFDDWKDGVKETQQKIAEPKPGYQISDKTGDGPLDVIRERIRNFPLASKTPIECQQFIFELQKQVDGTI